jgi:hypothetical protein
LHVFTTEPLKIAEIQTFVYIIVDRSNPGKCYICFSSLKRPNQLVETPIPILDGYWAKVAGAWR